MRCLAATLPSLAILYFLFKTINICTIIVFEYQYLQTWLLMQRSVSAWMSRQSWQFSIFSVNLEPRMSKQHWDFWLHVQLFQRSGRREKLPSRWHWSQIKMGLKRFLYQLECNFLQTWCINGICVLRSMHPHWTWLERCSRTRLCYFRPDIAWLCRMFETIRYSFPSDVCCIKWMAWEVFEALLNIY